jgi:hypothetical protein
MSVGNLILDQLQLTEVVGNNDDTTLKLLDGNGKRVDGFLRCQRKQEDKQETHHVQVVGRLVEEKDMGVLHGKTCEHDTAVCKLHLG